MLKQSSIHILASMVVILASSSCGMRSNWEVPDRGGHAYNTQQTQKTSAQTQGAQASGAQTQPARTQSHKQRATPSEDVQQGAMQAGERMYTVLAGERLYQIAERNGVSLHWLIKRNDLSRIPRSGTQIIIPATGAH